MVQVAWRPTGALSPSTLTVSALGLARAMGQQTSPSTQTKGHVLFCPERASSVGSLGNVHTEADVHSAQSSCPWRTQMHHACTAAHARVVRHYVARQALSQGCQLLLRTDDHAHRVAGARVVGHCVARQQLAAVVARGVLEALVVGDALLAGLRRPRSGLSALLTCT